MIALNGVEVTEQFSGLINLGEMDKLFTRGDGSDYLLYGTLFKLTDESIVVPPSEKHHLAAGSIQPFITNLILERDKLTRELDRLERTKAGVSEGVYDYGVSKLLVENLEFLTTNTIKPLPSLIVGGQLEYDCLEKNNADAAGFEEIWESWSHVRPGREKDDHVSSSMEVH